MGNAFGSQARRKLGDLVQERVFQRSLPAPLSPEQMEVMAQLTLREQARMQELPSLEKVNAKDLSLDKLLEKLSNSITGRVIDISPQASTSGSSSATRTSSTIGMTKLERAEASEKAEALINKGRLPSFILKDLFEKRNAAQPQVQMEGQGGGGVGQWEELGSFASSVGGDEKLLRVMMEHCCLPQVIALLEDQGRSKVGKVDTFGHQYAFARPPMWWRRGAVSGGKYRSEPEERNKQREPWEKMMK